MYSCTLTSTYLCLFLFDFAVDDISILSDSQAAHAKPLVTFDASSDGPEEKKIVLFNSNTNSHRHEIVSVRVNWPDVDVRDEATQSLLGNVHVSLVWPNSEGGPLFINNEPRRDPTDMLKHGLDFDGDYFEVLFEVDLKPLSFSTYTILKKKKSEVGANRKMPQVDFYQNEFTQSNVNAIQEEIKLK